MRGLVNGVIMASLFWALVGLIIVLWNDGGQILLYISVGSFLVFLAFLTDSPEKSETEDVE
jgi:hypothetical protein